VGRLAAGRLAGETSRGRLAAGETSSVRHLIIYFFQKRRCAIETGWGEGQSFKNRTLLTGDFRAQTNRDELSRFIGDNRQLYNRKMGGTYGIALCGPTVFQVRSTSWTSETHLLSGYLPID